MANMTIGKRMTLAFGLIGVLIVLIIGVTRWGLNNQADEYRAAAAATAKAGAAGDVAFYASEMIRSGTLYATESRHAAEGDKNDPAAVYQRYLDAVAELDGAYTKVNGMQLDSIDESIFNEIESELADFRAAEAKATALFKQGTVAAAVAGENLLASPEMISQIATLFDQVRELQLETQADARAASERAQSAANLTALLVLLVGAAALILSGLFAWLTTRSVVRPVRLVVAALQRVATGDLSVRLDTTSTDEIGQVGAGLNEALIRMSETVAGIEREAGSLTATSQQLGALSTQLSSSAEESASQAQSVSAAAEQVSSGIQSVAVASEELGMSEEEIARSTEAAAKVAATAVTVADAANATVIRLGESSTEIGEVVKVITSIAEQINLLALNATIEAARAGEAGESFAVVATEVKNLARKTAKSSDEIAQKITGMQANSNEAVSAIAEITKIIREINATQTVVAASVEEQTAATSEISRNTAEAAAGSVEIARSITDVAAASRDISKSAIATQASASAIAAVVGELTVMVDRFVITESR